MGGRGGSGAGGGVKIAAQEATLDQSYVFAVTTGVGNAGDITLDVEKLNLSGSAEIDASTYGPGRGGNLTIDAVDIVLAGRQGGRATGLFVTSEGTEPGSGDGGNLVVNTDRLEMSDGAQIIFI